MGVSDTSILVYSQLRLIRTPLIGYFRHYPLDTPSYFGLARHYPLDTPHWQPMLTA